MTGTEDVETPAPAMGEWPDLPPPDLSSTVRWLSVTVSGTGVAVAGDGPDVLIRDPRGRGTLAVDRSRWDAFLDGCRRGIFDGV